MPRSRMSFRQTSFPTTSAGGIGPRAREQAPDGGPAAWSSFAPARGTTPEASRAMGLVPHLHRLRRLGALSLLIGLSMGLEACTVLSSYLKDPTLRPLPLTTAKNSPHCAQYAEAIVDNPDDPLGEPPPSRVSDPSAEAAAGERGAGAGRNTPDTLGAHPRSLMAIAQQREAAAFAAYSNAKSRGATDAEAETERQRARRAPIDLNELVLSGGAQWGAYGVGFLNGIYVQHSADGQPHIRQPASDNILQDRSIKPLDPNEIPLDKYTSITGISTGALMIPEVWAAISLEKKARREWAKGDKAGFYADDSQAAQALIHLTKLYTQSTGELIKVKDQLLSTIVSNGNVDPSGLLSKQVLDSLTMYRRNMADDLRPGAGTTDVEAGAVNLVDGKFYSFSINKIVQADVKNNSTVELSRCGVEVLLASAAIPLSFPPRFIDDEPYMDGGVRYLAYFFGYEAGLKRAREARYDVRSVNVRLVVNGNQSVNDPADSADPDACDRSRAYNRSALAKCPNIANTLLGSYIYPKNAGKGLVLRVAQDVMVHQIKIDSVYRLYEDWSRIIAGDALSGSSSSVRPAAGTFLYTYISNRELAENHPDNSSSGPCEKRIDPKTKQHYPFDEVFEKCLMGVGETKGEQGEWLPKTPKLIRTPL